jgi:hypothetical protein
LCGRKHAPTFKTLQSGTEPFEGHFHNNLIFLKKSIGLSRHMPC